MPEAADRPLQSGTKTPEWACPYCHADGPHKAGVHTCPCGREYIASRVATTYPHTMMGYQAAAWDVEAVSRPPVKRAWSKTLLRRGKYQLTLFTRALSLSRTDDIPGGKTTWHPLHIRWLPAGGQGPHLRVCLRRPER